jgi:PAS domain S-box-containing protein
VDDQAQSDHFSQTVSEVPNQPEPSGSILVVDDDAVSLGALEELLTLKGYAVYTASEGLQAVEVFSAGRPDLVITDIRMPVMDGLELCRRITEIDPTVPVILVTGYGDLDNAMKALRRGAHDFLLKPINLEILMNAVEKGLEHCRLRRFEKDYRLHLEEEVKKRTKELAEANEFLQGILDSSTRVSIVITDFQHNVIFWNRGAQKIFGYTADEMLGESILKLYPAEDTTTETMGTLNRMLWTKAGTIQEHVRQIRKDGSNLTISMAVSPMLDASGKVRGVLTLGQDVTNEVRLHSDLLDSYKRIQRIQGASVFALARLAESRDGETAFHLRRLQGYSRALCHQLRRRELYRESMTLQFIEDLVQCSVLHDIGKVAIPDSVLFSPGKFGADEYKVMKRHAIYGGKALEEAALEAGETEGYLALGKDVAYYHHERWDGKGYPFGLKGNEIPLPARIVALADVYDALNTRRRYKRAYSHEEAVDLILAERGRQFDPEVVDAFIDIQAEFRRIRDEVSGEPPGTRPAVNVKSGV